MKQRIMFYVLKVALVTLLMPVITNAQRSKPKERIIEGHTMYTLLKPGDIPAIFDPEFVSIAEADALYHANEPLLVVVSESEAKGYSTWHLDNHEIVNDYINGTAITVTW